ncbi:3',5'-cyclic AMP phosphodiesterase CpdA [Streptomyces sp. MJP52]|nr:3',5'-cyclic AMP phosphodiesterase CpdA [Streptomyces sp. MJP52]
MVQEAGQTTAGREPVDFFVSYSPADERWASWIAWTLEQAGYRTVIQAWDFVPGTNFIDFMDRGVTESAAVIAVLSRNYERSTYGRLEWQAAYRASPEAPDRRLITVRVDDVPVEGLLATITWIDLSSTETEQEARRLLLARAEQACNGRARPEHRPRFPGEAPAPPLPGDPPVQRGASPAAPRPPGRRRPAAAPAFPRARGTGAPAGLTVLHLAGPDFGRGPLPDATLSELLADLVELRDAGAPDPDLLVVSGDLTASGSPRECEQALTFLTGLRSQLNLPPAQVAVVPGAQDVSQAACRAYFLSCEADETAPQKPYWEKWRHFSQRIFDPLYQGLDVVFAPDQPWTLFPVPELRTVVAGFNSSMAWSHRPDEQYGQVGRDQAAWFSTTLRDYERRGWFRLGVIRHPLTRPEGRGSERGPGRLRDADDFLRLAAPRLNMLLHGPSGPPRSPRTTPGYGTSADGLPLLGASAPGAFQLLEITREGVRRWHDVRETEPARFTPGWHRVDGVFGTPEPEPDEEERAAPAPADTFATRVLEICRVRRPGARFREITNVRPDDLTQYMATWEEDGVVRQSRVAVHPGTPALPEIARFAEQILQAGHDTAECVLVHAGDAPPPEVAERAPRFLRIRSFIEFQGLIDLRAYVRDQQAHLAGHASYPPGLYLRQRYREITRGEGEIHEDLLTDLLDALDSDQGRFLLLLGDFGHGKTFALRELARRMPEHSPHLVPVLVPLNTFDRAHSLLGLVTAHLAGHGVTRIDTRALRYMIREGRIVLLFDGFDELVNRVSYERAADHLEVLLSAAEHKAKIVVTSRTQHFKSDEQVFTALGERLGVLPQRRLLDIVGFRPTQIREYLSRSYGDDARAGQRYRLLEAVPDLLDLCQNPRLLSFVARLGDQHLQAVAGAGRALSPAALYQEVFTSWLRFEEARAAGGPGAAPGLTLDDLWTAVTALAERLWESGRQVLRLAELTETAGNALEGLGLTHMTRPEQVHSIASGSLLIRTPDGQFQFIHHSVVEWLLARRAALDLAEDSDRLLRMRALSALTVEFFCDLVDLERCEAWLNRTLQEPDAHPVARLNAVKISERLRVPSRHQPPRRPAGRGEPVPPRLLRRRLHRRRPARRHPGRNRPHRRRPHRRLLRRGAPGGRRPARRRPAGRGPVPGPSGPRGPARRPAGRQPLEPRRPGRPAPGRRPGGRPGALGRRRRPRHAGPARLPARPGRRPLRLRGPAGPAAGTGRLQPRRRTLRHRHRGRRGADLRRRRRAGGAHPAGAPGTRLRGQVRARRAGRRRRRRHGLPVGPGERGAAAPAGRAPRRRVAGDPGPHRAPRGDRGPGGRRHRVGRPRRLGRPPAPRPHRPRVHGRLQPRRPLPAHR